MANDFILILDFGGTQAQSMARKLRGQSYYCEIHPCDIDVAAVRRKSPKGLLLAGESSCSMDPSLLTMGLPVLAMGHAARQMALALDGATDGALLTECAAPIRFLSCPLFDGLDDSERYFNRVDALRLPQGFEPIAVTDDDLIAAFANTPAQLYGLQFYAESNDPEGSRILSNFAEKLCGCTPCWSPEYFIENETNYLRERFGDGHAVIAVSGGVDSTVSAMLTHRALGDRLHCIFVDTGLLRKGEAETFARTFVEQAGLTPTIVDAREAVLNALKGITDPAEKRRAIHREYLAALKSAAESIPQARYLVEGTIYPDLLRHPRAENAPDLDGFKLVEPIRMLFKDEVRYVGEALGLSKEFISQQSFPGSGLAVRCIGEVTAEKLALLREADAIFRAEIVKSGLDRKLSQYFAILTDSLAQCFRDGHTVREYACVLRAVTSSVASNVSVAKLPYDLIDRVTQRVTSQVPGIGRVLVDCTGKPIAPVEWE